MPDAISAEEAKPFVEGRQASSDRSLWAFVGLFAVILWARGAWEPAVSPTALADAIAHGAVSSLFSGRAIDLNAASAADLAAIPGIGDATAAKIVEDRSLRGPFPSVDDLDRVKGIGPHAIARFRDYVTVGSEIAGAEVPLAVRPLAPGPRVSTRSLTRSAVEKRVPTSSGRPMRKARQSRSADRTPRRIDPNTAGLADWDRLPGIGPSIAAAIVADRAANGPFVTADDLTRVKGIGPKKLEKILPWLTGLSGTP